METNTKQVVIDFLADRKKELIAKRERLYAPVKEVEEELDHLSATLRSLQKPIGIQIHAALNEFPIGKIRSLTQVQALTVIAKHNGGLLRAQEAKRLLIRAGVMRETKNSTNIIHAVIVRSEKFEKVRPGEYRLKEAPNVVSATHMLEDVAKTSAKPVQ